MIKVLLHCFSLLSLLLFAVYIFINEEKANERLELHCQKVFDLAKVDLENQSQKIEDDCSVLSEKRQRYTPFFELPKRQRVVLDSLKTVLEKGLISIDAAHTKFWSLRPKSILIDGAPFGLDEKKVANLNRKRIDYSKIETQNKAFLLSLEKLDLCFNQYNYVRDWSTSMSGLDIIWDRFTPSIIPKSFPFDCNDFEIVLIALRMEDVSELQEFTMNENILPVKNNVAHFEFIATDTLPIKKIFKINSRYWKGKMIEEIAEREVEFIMPL